MAYPNVPDLTAFDGKWVPNLLTGGPYDEQLTKVEDYLNQLGAYVDSQLAELRESVSAEIQDIHDQLAEDAASLAELGDHVNELSQWQENAGNIVVNVPTGIDSAGTGVTTSAVKLIEPTGTQGGAAQALANVAGNLMLAAPNGASDQLLGWLGDNSRSAIEAPTVQASAALTYAAEQGGASAAGVYGVPVVYNASNGVTTLAAYEDVTLHQYDTVLIAESNFKTGVVGSVLQYVGSASLVLGIEPVPFTSDEFQTIWEPEEVPAQKSKYSLIPVNTEDGANFKLAPETGVTGNSYFTVYNNDFLLVVSGSDAYVGDLYRCRTQTSLFTDSPAPLNTTKICNVTELVGHILNSGSKVTAQDLADGLGTAGRGIVMNP